MTYAEKLKDPRWLKKREEILNRDSWQCRRCRKSGNLHVHHIRYIKGREPWEYHDFYLVTLCAKHHEEEHEELGRAYLPEAPVSAPAPIEEERLPIPPEAQAILDRFDSLFEESKGLDFSNPRYYEIHKEIMAMRKSHGFLHFRNRTFDELPTVPRRWSR